MIVPEMEKPVADLNSRCKECRERATKLKIEIDRHMERDRQAEFASWQRELSERMKQTDGSNSRDTNSNVDYVSYIVERVEEYGDK